MTKHHPNMVRLIEALRSGEYTQVTGQLGKRLPDGTVGNCCLGVASRLAGVRGRWAWWGAGIVYDGEPKVAPPRVQDWLGVSSCSNPANPDIDYPEEYATYQEQVDDAVLIFDGIGSMAELNDAGFTFAQIADILDYFGVR